MIFAIKSTNSILPQGAQPAIVLVEDGLIKDILPYEANVPCPLYNAGNKVLMAGVIDPHIHINEPGRVNWEGFNTATKAAIAGGLTTLVDMPLNASPVTTTVAAFEEKLASLDGQLHTNCGFWGGIVPGNTAEIEPLIQKGVLGFKAFLTHSGIDEFPNATEDDLRKAMPIIMKYNLPLLVHCELTDDFKPENQDPLSYQDYLASRPKYWEDDAIRLMIGLCEEYNCRVHIVHLSSSNSIQQIARAKQRGLALTVETAQHYIYFNAEEIKDGQTQFKCAPPIREKANNDLLWQALKDGIIDFVATDHSPAPPDLKETQSGDFSKAWGGISSLQFALPVLWTAAKQRGFAPAHIAKWLSEEPAKLAGLQNNKGKIAIGYDADLVIWNADQSFVLTEAMIEHKHKISPYIGETLFGIVEQTYLSGIKVFDRGEFILNTGKPILGRDNYLRRAENIFLRINELASITEDGGAITRTFGTKAFLAGSAKVSGWMKETGLETHIDNIGNVRGKLMSNMPDAKTFIIASHIDTVVNAGKFDGPLGVLLGLDLLENLIQDKTELPFNIELIAFSDEEGVRFHTTYLGSKVITGAFDDSLLDKKDKNGISLKEAIKIMGGNIDLLPLDTIAFDDILGYYEVHIEQGPVLYESKIPVAVVTGIAGQKRVEITFTGIAGHAGTVPMDMRNDALTCAAEFISTTEHFGKANKNDLVATVGKLDVINAASNVIPGKVICSLDLRSADENTLLNAYQKLKNIAQSVAAKREITLNWNLIQETKSVNCDDGLNQLLKQAISDAKYEIVELVSGAGHDAVPLSMVCPATMLFVRCFEGISHNPLENAELADVAAAIKVSAGFIDLLIKKYE